MTRNLRNAQSIQHFAQNCGVHKLIATRYRKSAGQAKSAVEVEAAGTCSPQVLTLPDYGQRRCAQGNIRNGIDNVIPKECAVHLKTPLECKTVCACFRARQSFSTQIGIGLGYDISKPE